MWQGLREGWHKLGAKTYIRADAATSVCGGYEYIIRLPAGLFGQFTLCQFGVGVVSISQFTIAAYALAQFAFAYSLIAQFGIYIHEGHGQLVKSLSELLGML